MEMTITEQIIIVAAVVAATMLTRFLPFLIFRSSHSTPDYIRYLGRVLPAAVFGLLVIYCVRNVDIFTGAHGLPEFIGILATALLHRWKRQMLFSIAGGTITYMTLIQMIFI